jgi:hypothetical protein
MRSILAVILVSMNLQGCALLAWNAIKPIEIEKKAVARTPLNLPDPTPIKPAVPRWIIITPENQARVFEELRAANADQVLFALTDDGYEELAIDFAATRNFLSQQREMLKKYREYYEPKEANKK